MEPNDGEGTALSKLEASGAVRQETRYVPDFDTFQKWLMSADGGKKDIKSAEQHTSQLTAIFGCVYKDQQQLINKNNVNDKFLDVYISEKKFLPGTIHSCMSSLIHWFDYLLVGNEDSI